MAASTFTRPDGTFMAPPLLRLWLGRNGFRWSDFESFVQATQADRWEQEFRIPPSRRARMMHLVIGNFAAGRQWSRLFASADLSQTGRHRAGQDGT